MNRVVTWNVCIVYTYNLCLILGLGFKRGKAGQGLGMRQLYDHVLVISTDWENPAPEIPVHEWKCEFTDAGREGGREGGGGGREGKQYSCLQTWSSFYCNEREAHLIQKGLVWGLVYTKTSLKAATRLVSLVAYLIPRPLQTA